MKYLPLVWAALLRKPAEAILICLAVTAAFMLFDSMLGLRATYDRIVASSRMDRLEVDVRFPVTNGLHLPIAMREQIARLDGVSAVGSLYVLRGYLHDPHDTLRVRAVDTNMQQAWSELPLSAAQWQRLFATPTGVLVSRRSAQARNLKPGDVLPLVTPPGARADGAPSWEFHVLEIVPDDPSHLYGGYILGNYKYVDISLPLQEQGYAMEFRVAIKDPARANEISQNIDHLFANSGTPTITIPMQANEKFAINSGIAAASVTWPVAGAGVFMILLLMANGIAQSVRERIPEFAVLKTLGYRNTTLSALVFMEAAAPCVIGGILGTMLAAVVAQWPRRFLPQDLLDLPKPTMSIAVLATASVCVVLLTMASTVIPILRFRRMSVVDALAGR
jgi:putative ABC transport system permease protein